MSRYHLRLLLTAIVAIIASLLMLRECTSERADAPNQFRPGSGDTINVAIEYAPLSLYRQADTLGGFNYDLIRQILHHANRPVKFAPFTTLSQALEWVDNDVCQVVVAAVPVTAELRQRYGFTEPLYLDRQILISSDTTVTTQLDLAGKTIYVPSGSPMGTRLKALAREIGDTIMINADSGYNAEQLAIMAAVGEIGYAVVNERVALEIAKSYPDVNVKTPVSFNQFQSWLLPVEATALTDSLNRWIDCYKQTTDYDRLLVRYGMSSK